MYDADYKVLMQLKACRDKLKPQQYRTIRGQIFSGDTKGAIKGLQRILKKIAVMNSVKAAELKQAP